MSDDLAPSASSDAEDDDDDEDGALDVQSWIQQAFARQASALEDEHERAKQAFLERALELRRAIEEESCEDEEEDD